MNYTIIIDEIAEKAIAKYVSYIAIDQHAPTIASNVHQRIYDDIQSLSMFHKRCRIAPDRAYSNYEIRMLLIDQSIALYAVDEEKKTVNILAFRHTRQLPLKNIDKEGD